MDEGEMYMDKASQFACAVIDESGGLPLRRFEQIFDHLYIDEVQDLAGYDLDLVEHLLNSDVSITLVGDVRQATYRTNPSAKNSAYAGLKIIRKFDEWCKEDHTKIEHHNYSYRCIQAICDFADQFYPDLHKTESRNKITTDHDGAPPATCHYCRTTVIFVSSTISSKNTCICLLPAGTLHLSPVTPPATIAAPQSFLYLQL